MSSGLLVVVKPLSFALLSQVGSCIMRVRVVALYTYPSLLYALFLAYCTHVH
jgi:hypothetical protein